MVVGMLGMDCLFGDYGDGWLGSVGGGCGIWVIVMCNCILGKVFGVVMKFEWNMIVVGIGQNVGGGLNVINCVVYYQFEYGCDISYSIYIGFVVDYVFIKKKLQEGYDFKFCFYEIIYNEVGDIVDYDYGYVEIVIGVMIFGGERIVIINLWGNQVCICGGMCNNFFYLKYLNMYFKFKMFVCLDVVGFC